LEIDEKDGGSGLGLEAWRLRREDCGEGGGSTVQLRRTGGGLTGRPRMVWRRRTGFRALDQRCVVAAAECGEGGGCPVQLRRTGAGLTGQRRTGAGADWGGGGLRWLCNWRRTGGVGRAREVGWAPRSQRRDTRPERRQSHGCGEANAVLRTIFFSSSHFLAVETTSHLSRGMSGYISTTTWLY
jgi:hypothetical protein